MKDRVKKLISDRQDKIESLNKLFCGYPLEESVSKTLKVQRDKYIIERDILKYALLPINE